MSNIVDSTNCFRLYKSLQVLQRETVSEHLRASLFIESERKKMCFAIKEILVKEFISTNRFNNRTVYSVIVAVDLIAKKLDEMINEHDCEWFLKTIANLTKLKSLLQKDRVCSDFISCPFLYHNEGFLYCSDNTCTFITNCISSLEKHLRTHPRREPTLYAAYALSIAYGRMKRFLTQRECDQFKNDLTLWKRDTQILNVLPAERVLLLTRQEEDLGLDIENESGDEQPVDDEVQILEHEPNAVIENVSVEQPELEVDDEVQILESDLQPQIENEPNDVIENVSGDEQTDLQVDDFYDYDYEGDDQNLVIDVEPQIENEATDDDEDLEQIDDALIDELIADSDNENDADDNVEPELENEANELEPIDDELIDNENVNDNNEVETNDNLEEIEDIQNRILEENVLTDDVDREQAALAASALADAQLLRRNTERALSDSIDGTLSVLPEIGSSQRVSYKDEMINQKEQTLKMTTTLKDITEMHPAMRKKLSLLKNDAKHYNVSRDENKKISCQVCQFDISENEIVNDTVCVLACAETVVISFHLQLFHKECVEEIFKQWLDIYSRSVYFYNSEIEDRKCFLCTKPYKHCYSIVTAEEKQMKEIMFDDEHFECILCGKTEKNDVEGFKGFSHWNKNCEELMDSKNKDSNVLNDKLKKIIQYCGNVQTEVKEKMNLGEAKAGNKRITSNLAAQNQTKREIFVNFQPNKRSFKTRTAEEIFKTTVCIYRHVEEFLISRQTEVDWGTFENKCQNNLRKLVRLSNSIVHSENCEGNGLCLSVFDHAGLNVFSQIIKVISPFITENNISFLQCLEKRQLKKNFGCETCAKSFYNIFQLDQHLIEKNHPKKNFDVFNHLGYFVIANQFNHKDFTVDKVKMTKPDYHITTKSYSLIKDIQKRFPKVKENSKVNETRKFSSNWYSQSSERSWNSQSNLKRKSDSENYSLSRKRFGY